jgi:hypothetical protein
MIPSAAVLIARIIVGPIISSISARGNRSAVVASASGIATGAGYSGVIRDAAHATAPFGMVEHALPNCGKKNYSSLMTIRDQVSRHV